MIKMLILCVLNTLIIGLIIKFIFGYLPDMGTLFVATVAGYTFADLQKLKERIK